MSDQDYVPVLVTERGKIDRLGAQLDTMMRASEQTVANFVEPVAGSLMKALAPRHHFIFGRRGSGKSSLMFKARAELLGQGRAVAFVDLQNQSRQSLPNLLLKTVELVLADLRDGRGVSKVDFKKLDAHIAKARSAFMVPDVLKKTVTEKSGQSLAGGGSAAMSFNMPLITRAHGGVTARTETSQGVETVTVYDEHKIVLVNQVLEEFAALLKEMSSKAGGVYVFLDDAYYVSAADQPSYFHHLQAVCGRHAWLKIGAVKHRTVPYAADEHGPRGLQLGHDASEIDLDSSLEDYATTEDFLMRLLSSALEPCEIRTKDLLSKKALERMVQTSGGVARDFLAILSESIDRARERILQTHAAVKRGEKSEKELRSNQRIGAPDIWSAASRLNESKKAALRNDMGESGVGVFDLLARLLTFVTERDRVNSVLLQDPQSFWQHEGFLKLFEFKMVHILDRQRRLRGEDYALLMLDVGELAHNQAYWERALDLLDAGDQAKAERASQRFSMT